MFAVLVRLHRLQRSAGRFGGSGKDGLTKGRGDRDVKSCLPATPVLEENVSRARLRVVHQPGFFESRKTGVASGFEDGVAHRVMAMDSLVFRGASDRMVAKDVGVFSTRRAGMGSIVDWETQPVSQSHSKVFWQDGEAQRRIRDGVEKGPSLGQ